MKNYGISNAMIFNACINMVKDTTAPQNLLIHMLSILYMEVLL